MGAVHAGGPPRLTAAEESPTKMPSESRYRTNSSGRLMTTLRSACGASDGYQAPSWQASRCACSAADGAGGASEAGSGRPGIWLGAQRLLIAAPGAAAALRRAECWQWRCCSGAIGWPAGGRPRCIYRHSQHFRRAKPQSPSAGHSTRGRIDVSAIPNGARELPPGPDSPSSSRWGPNRAHTVDPAPARSPPSPRPDYHRPACFEAVPIDPAPMR
jgi:hypothetical protein